MREEPRMSANEREFVTPSNSTGLAGRFLIPSNSRGLSAGNRVEIEAVGKGAKV